MFTSKSSYRIVNSDSVDDATILLPDTQVDNVEDERTDADIIILEESTTSTIEKPEENVIAFIDKKSSSLMEYIEKRFHNLEDQTTGLQNANLPRNVVKPATTENGWYVNLFKNWILELKNQLRKRTPSAAI